MTQRERARLPSQPPAFIQVSARLLALRCHPDAVSSWPVRLKSVFDCTRTHSESQGTTRVPSPPQRGNPSGVSLNDDRILKHVSKSTLTAVDKRSVQRCCLSGGMM